jgi:diguanylate cyclase (GGDEF)-like protein/PAS domain S-box-containing protein
VIHRARGVRAVARSGRGIIVAIFITFGVVAALTVTLSIRSTDRARNQAAVIEVIGRQRTLAERYISEVQFVRGGEVADPARTAAVLAASAHALLYGGTAPATYGDDDETTLAPASGGRVRAQLAQGIRLVNDLTAAGRATLANLPAAHSPLTAGESIDANGALQRLRVLGALTSNAALSAGRTIAAQADQSIDHLVMTQIVLGAGGLLISLLLAWGLIATTRRQNSHFRTLVTSSSDLVFVLGDDGCRYASRSLCKMVGRSEPDLLGDGLERFIHEDDRDKLAQCCTDDAPQAIQLRARNADGELRYLEAHLTDLRGDRQLRGVVISARDVTERVRLEEELMRQTQRDAFGAKVVEALEMADDEHTALDVVERAMVEIAPDSPMELLLSDSSRAHLQPAVASSTSGAPGCPVQSPFACVAVRRGQAVQFDSSEALNACPKLRNRVGGPCSATCVPVSFMGRALGVLHATGPEGAPGTVERLGQLTTLATQAGARIGTVRAFEKTQLQAATDGLTGLINRRTLENAVREMLSRGQLVALAMSDLDHFKAINDRYGHEAGDRALRLFAQVSRDALRDADILGRWGGEEFVIALPGIDRHAAAQVLERVRQQLAQAHTGAHPRFTASFGVTDSAAGADLERMIQLADAALYQSKHEGRDRITVGDDAPTEAPAGERPILPGRLSLHEALDDEDPRESSLDLR